MANTISNSINPATPTGSSARSLGDDQIRALKQAVIDILGIPSATTLTGSLFLVSSAGSIYDINLAGSTIKLDKVELTNLDHTLSQIWFKGALPNVRLVGTEGSAKDWRLVETSGNVEFQENTGTEGNPTWATRLILNSADGDIVFYSGTVNKVRLAHAATADRVITFPDGTTTLLGADTAQAITGKTSLVMASAGVITPAAVVGTPAAHSLYQENVVKAWINMDGTGTPSITDSFNITSITDNGTGDYTITWDRDFANLGYAVVGSARNTGVAGVGVVCINDTSAIATGSVRIKVQHENGGTGAVLDSSIICVIAIGDQA